MHTVNVLKEECLVIWKKTGKNLGSRDSNLQPSISIYNILGSLLFSLLSTCQNCHSSAQIPGIIFVSVSMVHSLGKFYFLSQLFTSHAYINLLDFFIR
jgi:hypothetical protein